MSILDNLRDRLMGQSQNYNDYDDYDESYDGYDQPYDDYPANDRPTSGVLGNTSRPEAESVSVYTRSGRPVDEGVPSPSAGGFSTSQRMSEESWGVGSTHRALDDRPSTSVLGGQSTVTPGDIGLTPVPRVNSGKLPPYVLKPTSYDDVQMVIRRVRTNQPVVLSFKNTQIEIAKRILDFCFGLSCGVNGSVEELGDRVFVVLPAGIELSQADLDKLVSDRIIEA
ncbi:cell division protein SepF [Leptogranulimonas caecicola]|uniref:cell division protein SepF n=1 Tax=Leptogranulimonas caecicola TaxID=2894156 RepID=UPI001BEDD6AB|nr:hypothetical protein ATOBIA_N11770 [Atopobiaceae bacterium P1]